jgi:two-component system CheB/CheR fusion protein
MKSKTRKKVFRGGATYKKASELKRKKGSTSSRPMSAGQTREPGDKVQPETRRLKGRTPNHFPVVGIGASAGGLEAFTELLKNLPLDTGMGFVLVQHLDPQHESALVDLLSRATSMPVREVTNNLRVEANHIYVIPPNTNLGIAQGVLKLQPREQSRTPTRSIDSFFESLAQDQRERAIGVILSGTATDGTVGMEAVKAEGGITFAQDDSARYDSMPRSDCGGLRGFRSQAGGHHKLARIAKHPSAAVNRLKHLPGRRPGVPRLRARTMKFRCRRAAMELRRRVRRPRAPKLRGGTPKRERTVSKKFSCSSAIIPAWTSPSTHLRRSSGASPAAWC